MIERQFISQNMKEYQIQEYISSTLKGAGLSHAKLVKTPAGVKIVIYASRPGLIVGKRGANIKELTKAMKSKFNLENPQIEIAEVENINLDPNIVAERIASTLERFGTQRFKGIGDHQKRAIRPGLGLARCDHRCGRARLEGGLDEIVPVQPLALDGDVKIALGECSCIDRDAACGPVAARRATSRLLGFARGPEHAFSHRANLRSSATHPGQRGGRRRAGRYCRLPALLVALAGDHQ